MGEVAVHAIAEYISKMTAEILVVFNYQYAGACSDVNLFVLFDNLLRFQERHLALYQFESFCWCNGLNYRLSRRKSDSEACTDIFLTPQRDLASVCEDELSDQGQTQARTRCPFRLIICPVEPFEYVRLLILGNANTGVRDSHCDPILVIRLNTHRDTAATRRIFNGVGEQVDDDRVQRIGIAARPYRRCGP